jgi:hypothetical protein
MTDCDWEAAQRIRTLKAKTELMEELTEVIEEI